MPSPLILKLKIFWRSKKSKQALLQQAAFDHDVKVAELAGRAVADLQQLAQGTTQPGR